MVLLMDIKTRSLIKAKLAAVTDLKWLHQCHNDVRGLEHAAMLEREAHSLWRAEGNASISTHDLICWCEEQDRLDQEHEID